MTGAKRIFTGTPACLSVVIVFKRRSGEVARGSRLRLSVVSNVVKDKLTWMSCFLAMSEMISRSGSTRDDLVVIVHGWSSSWSTNNSLRVMA